MKLEKVIEIASFIYNSEEIPKEGLKMTYKISLEEHKNLDRELYIKSNNSSEYKHNDDIEVNIGGIVFKFEVINN
jgi:hypothetical protein